MIPAQLALFWCGAWIVLIRDKQSDSTTVGCGTQFTARRVPSKHASASSSSAVPGASMQIGSPAPGGREPPRLHLLVQSSDRSLRPHLLLPIQASATPIHCGTSVLRLIRTDALPYLLLAFTRRPRIWRARAPLHDSGVAF
jgi:hypothetical protein